MIPTRLIGTRVIFRLVLASGAALSLTPGRSFAGPSALLAPAKNSITPEGAAVARNAALEQAAASENSGDREGAARQLVADATRLKDPELFIAAANRYHALAVEKRDADTATVAMIHARVAIDMLSYLAAGQGSGAWLPVAGPEQAALLDEAGSIAEREQALIAEIAAEREAAANPAAPPEKSKAKKPGLGLTIAGAGVAAIGLAGAGLGFAGLAIGSKQQTAIDDPNLVNPNAFDSTDQKGRNANVMAYIGLPLAAVGLGVGAALIAIGVKKMKAGDRSASTQAMVVPAFGTRTAGFALSGRF